MEIPERLANAFAGILIANVLMVVFCCSSAGAGDHEMNAPFGLRWGMTTEEMQEMLKNVEEVDNKGFGRKFVARVVPKMIGDADAYILITVPNFGLQSAGAISGPLSCNENSLVNANLIYSRWVEGVKAKYGKPREYHGYNKRSGRSFCSCLLEPKCGVWSDVWHGGNYTSVWMNLHGIDSLNGYLSIEYFGPKFDKAVMSKRAKDRDGF